MPRADAPLLNRLNHGLREALTPIGRVNRQKERAIEKTLPSTVSIITLGPDRGQGGSMEIGSGFAVATISAGVNKPREVILATNKHVVDHYNEDTEGLLKLFVVTSGASGGVRDESRKQEFVNAQVAHVSSRHDLAFLRLSLAEHPEVNLPPLKLGHSTLVDAPDTLLSIGAPLGTQDTVTELQVSQNNLTEVESEEGVDLYRQISITNPGMSGGALIDPLFAGLFARPTVVGMPTLGAQNNPTQGYMLPAEVIQEELHLFLAKEQARMGGRRTFITA